MNALAEESEVGNFVLRKGSIATLFLVIPGSVVAMMATYLLALNENPVLTFVPISCFGVINVPCGLVTC